MHHISSSCAFSTVAIAANSAFITFLLTFLINWTPKDSVSPAHSLPSMNEHFSLSHRGLKHYTLPPIENISKSQEMPNITISNLHFPIGSRGIVNCSHFESEVSCEELVAADSIINSTLKSGRYLFVRLPSDIESAMSSLSFAFMIAASSNRRLFIQSAPFPIPSIVAHPPKLPKVTKTVFSADSVSPCDTVYIASCISTIIVLKGSWDFPSIFLSPGLPRSIPGPFLTHSRFLLNLWLFPFRNITFPSRQLQIGISLEFLPNPERFCELIDRLREGYNDWRVIIYNRIRAEIPKQLSERVSLITSFNEAAQVLPQCDIFVGSIGFRASHFLNAIRGRGGLWMDPRDTTLFETSSSQSGMVFLMNGRKANDLMCPEGSKEFQSFLLFEAF